MLEEYKSEPIPTSAVFCSRQRTVARMQLSVSRLLVSAVVISLGIAPTVAAQQSASRIPPVAPRAFLDKYCVGCHNQRAKIAQLTLDALDVDRVGDAPATWEKVVRKLRIGAMPPATAARPDA